MLDMLWGTMVPGRFSVLSTTGHKSGPYTTDEMRSLFIDGDITDSTLISSSDNETWVPLSQSILFAHMPRPPSSGPPPLIDEDRKSLSFSKEAVAARKSMRIASLRKSHRTTSQRLLRAPVLDMDQYLWTENEGDEDENDVWSLCCVQSQDNTILQLQDLRNSRVFKVDMGFRQVMKYNDSIVSDMAQLNNIHEPGVIYNLQQRYVSGQPYTFIGPILVAVQGQRIPETPSFDPALPIPPTPHAAGVAGDMILCYIEERCCDRECMCS